MDERGLFQIARRGTADIRAPANRGGREAVHVIREQAIGRPIEQVDPFRRGMNRAFLE